MMAHRWNKLVSHPDSLQRSTWRDPPAEATIELREE
jgi:hypothetical protein